ncbi:MAG: hypothetical protein LBS97_04910 [Treponema sp.]|jgi:hypothetical protein|nr:hypothetical protein [Treponema sp.]
MTVCFAGGSKEPVVTEKQQEYMIETPVTTNPMLIRQPPPEDYYMYAPQVTAEPDSPIMDLFTAYNQEFNERLWLMARFNSGMGILYAGSFFIDMAGGIEPNYNHSSGKIDIEQGLRKTHEITIYFSYQAQGRVFTGTRGSLRFFTFTLSSEQIYSYIVQRRNGIIGFEIAVRETARSEIP